MLLHAHWQPWSALFIGALASGGDGTLRGRPGLPATVRAKTGIIRHTVSLAGYLDPAAVPTVFAVLVKHWFGERRKVRSEVVPLVRSWK